MTYLQDLQPTCTGVESYNPYLLNTLGLEESPLVFGQTDPAGGLIGMPNPLHSDGLVDYEDVLGFVKDRRKGARFLFFFKNRLPKLGFQSEISRELIPKRATKKPWLFRVYRG